MRLIKHLTNRFLEHPNEQGMTYVGHFVRAMGIAVVLAIAVVMITVHAIFPFIFVHNVSKIIETLHIEMNHGQDRL